MIKLYTTHCPRCKVLEKKKTKKGINYEEIDSMDIMTENGFKSVPVLELEDGTILDFAKANSWINEQEGAQ